MQAASLSLQESRVALADSGAAAHPDVGTDGTLGGVEQRPAATGTPEAPVRKRKRAASASTNGADNSDDPVQPEVDPHASLAAAQTAFTQLQQDCDDTARKHGQAVQRYERELSAVDRAKIAADVSARDELAALAATIADAQASATRLHAMRYDLRRATDRWRMRWLWSVCAQHQVRR